MKNEKAGRMVQEQGKRENNLPTGQAGGKEVEVTRRSMLP